MTYDLIMIVASKDDDLIRMTQSAIDSCRADGADVNVIVVETWKETVYKNVDKVLMYEGEFNYNRALNLGIKNSTGDICILANNDIKFEKGWSTIGHTMKVNDILSASALSTDPRQRSFKRGNYSYEGYIVGYHLTGWCLFVDRKVFTSIKKLDESVTFWYSDNVYADQLIRAKIKHHLICNVTVLHYTSRTLSKENIHIQKQLTHAQRKRILKPHSPHIQKTV